MPNFKFVFRLVLRIFFLSLPFFIYAILIYITDPFNILRTSSTIDENIKLQYAAKLNEPLWTINQFNIKPKSSVLFGDSRMILTNLNNINTISGKNYSNMAFGGANLNEIIKTFWYVSSKVRLSDVYFGLNFDFYNQLNNRDRVTGAIAVFKNKLLYFTNLNVLEAFYYCIRDQFFEMKVDLERPFINFSLSKDAYWKWKLNQIGSKFYDSYVYPHQYYDELRKIRIYCLKHHIHLTFIILPVHQDLQKFLINKNLTGAEYRFINDIRHFGDVYDFNVSNYLTTNRDNFVDPIHGKKIIYDTLVKIVFSKGLKNIYITNIYKFYPSY